MAEEVTDKKPSRRRKSKAAVGVSKPAARRRKKKPVVAEATSVESVESSLTQEAVAPAPAEAESKVDPLLKATPPEIGKAPQAKTEPKKPVEEVVESVSSRPVNRAFHKKGTMTVKTIKKDRCYYGARRFRFEKGEMLTLPDEQAKWLISTGRAVG
jgi:hypothetical protein